MYIIVSGGGSGAGGGVTAGTDITEYSNPSGGTLTGARNNANKIYTVSHTPLTNRPLNMYIDGTKLDPSDFSVVATVFTITSAAIPAPTAAQSVAVEYEY